MKKKRMRFCSWKSFGVGRAVWAGILIFVSLLCCAMAMGQAPGPSGDTTRNNLALPAGYTSCEYGSLPFYKKAGKGKQALILIPGLGFDASVFDDFMEANKDLYTMYAVTIPGYGQTMAPAMPVAGTSYGDQSWNNSFSEGLLKLIEKEKLQRPVIAGHFVQGAQVVLRLAIDHPESVGGVIVLGGPAKFVFIDKGVPRYYPLKGSIAYIDNYTAPKFFKIVSKAEWDQGNYLPEIYSLDSVKGRALWNQSQMVPLPVMIRYLCEFLASDITLETEKIKCPVLILRAGFNHVLLDEVVNNYVKPQFIDSWDEAAKKNPGITIKDIPDAASFIWKDNLPAVDAALRAFFSRLK